MPLRRRLARWLDSPVMLDQELMTLLCAGSRGYRMEPKFPGILTDDELRAVGLVERDGTGRRVPEADAVRAASEAPSRLLGLNGGRGSLAPGSPADLIVAAERLGARRVMHAGHWLDAA